MKIIKRVLAFLLAVTLTLNCIGTSPAFAATEIDVDTVMSKEEYADSSTGTTMPYRLYVPEDYDVSKTYPVIVFLHGAGERGVNNTSQLLHAIQNLFDTHEKMKQSIVIAPQCPGGKRWVETDWTQGNYDSSVIEEVQLGTVMKILKSVQEKYSTDNDRIYAFGLSMGGFGTWNLLMNHSDVFAAGVPICGGADPAKAEVLKDIPIWTFHGTADVTVPYDGTAEMYNAIISAGGNSLKFTTYTGGLHNIWNVAAQTEGLIDWLFSQKLSKRTEAEKVEAENLFDKNDRDVWLNALSHNGEKLENTNNYANIFTTHKIEVKQGDTIYWGGFARENYVMELYAADDTFIKQINFDDTNRMATGTSVQGVGSSSKDVYRYAYKIQEEAAGYVRILGNISIMDSFAVYLNLEEPLEGWPSFEARVESVLNGKSIIFTGDSITAAARDDYGRSGWAGRIGMDYGMNYINAGVSGASVSTARGTNRVLPQLMKHASSEVDYIIFHGGVNDAMESAPIGIISDSYEIEDFDTDTFAGGLEELFAQAYANFKGSRFGYIVNYATPNSTWGGDTKDMGEYFAVAKQICEKWNIPYIDLYSGTVEVDGETLSYSYDILNVNSGMHMYNDDAGEVHIGGSGYDLIAPYIAQWVETLQVNEIPDAMKPENIDYKAKIENKLAQIAQMDLSAYTEETVEVLTYAKNHANEVLAMEEVTYKETEPAYNALKKAIAGLVEKQAEVEEPASVNLALYSQVTLNDGGTNAYRLTDGKVENVYSTSNVDVAQSYAMVELPGKALIEDVKVITYSNNLSKWYTWEVFVSDDNSVWTSIGKYETESNPGYEGYTIHLEEPVNASYVKVQGVKTNNNQLHLVEIEVYGKMDNIALGKKAETNIVRSENDAYAVENITDGELSNSLYWDTGNNFETGTWNDLEEENRPYAIVDLGGIYKLDTINVMNYYNANRYYHYDVYVSIDGEEYTLLGSKEDSIAAYWTKNFYGEKNTNARFIKVVGKYNSANSGYHINELRVTGTLVEILFADYTAVEEAKAKVPEDLSVYTIDSVVDLKLALANVEEELSAAYQEKVDAMAQAIENAVAALKEKPEEPVKQEVCEIYPDVIHGEWYETAVQYVHENGIMTGSNGLFKPTGEEGQLLRQQFVMILWRMEGEPAAETDAAIKDLQDINGDEWYIDALCWAYENGVVTGVGGTMFKGANPITRQQLATMMYRYAEKMGYDTSKTADYSNMPGANDVESYAAEAMAWAVGSGIISGSGADKALNPAAGATRAQIATVIQRFCEENK